MNYLLLLCFVTVACVELTVSFRILRKERTTPDLPPSQCWKPRNANLCVHLVYDYLTANDCEREHCYCDVYGDEGCLKHERNYFDKKYCKEICGGLEDREVPAELPPFTYSYMSPALLNCSIPSSGGRCRRVTYNYDEVSDKCETIDHGSCLDYDNTVYDEEVCERVCERASKEDTENIAVVQRPWGSFYIEGMDACEYPKGVGPCRAGFRRYFFDGEKCTRFIYGGCGGNPNNFRTKKDCIERCGSKTGTEIDSNSISEIIDSDLSRKKRSFEPPSNCIQVPNPGACDEFENIYIYNSTTEECEMVVNGGCLGDENNFYDLETCEEICKGILPTEENDDTDFSNEMEGKERCGYPKDVGPCRAGFPFYYFNGEKCEIFIYGGCGGNPNRFYSEEECKNTCEHEDEGV